MEELLHITTADAQVGQKHQYWSKQVTAHVARLEIDVQRKLDFSGTFSVRTLVSGVSANGTDLRL